MSARLPGFTFRSTSTSAALAVAAVFMLLPANLLPVLTTQVSGGTRNDTIFSGALALWQQGMWPLAVIVWTASIVIPGLKLAGLGWLLFNARRTPCPNPRRLTRIYAALDFIGRWSMLDVFLGAFLTGLVKFGQLSTVTARSGIVAFAAVVVLTVLATEAFDPRQFWRDGVQGLSPSPSP